MDRFAEIQIIGKKNGKVQNSVKVSIKDVLQDDFGYSIKSFTDGFYDFSYTHGIDDNLILVGIIFYFPEEYLNNEQVDSYLYSVLQKIREDSHIECVTLFHNSIDLLTSNPEMDQKFILLFKQIVKLENKLREAVSLIFYTNYPNQYYKTLEKHDVSLPKGFDKNTVIDKFENEFFYLPFSDYKKLTEIKKEEYIDFKNSLLERFKKALDFDDFKRSLERPIFKSEMFQDFLLSIKTLIDPIEKMRNCIMHGRRISDTLQNDYQPAYDSLLSKIEEFFSKIKPKCPKCNSEMFIQNGKRGKFWSCNNWRNAENNCNGNISI